MSFTYRSIIKTIDDKNADVIKQSGGFYYTHKINTNKGNIVHTFFDSKTDDIYYVTTQDTDVSLPVSEYVVKELIYVWNTYDYKWQRIQNYKEPKEITTYRKVFERTKGGNFVLKWENLDSTINGLRDVPAYKNKPYATIFEFGSTIGGLNNTSKYYDRFLPAGFDIVKKLQSEGQWVEDFRPVVNLQGTNYSDLQVTEYIIDHYDITENLTSNNPFVYWDMKDGERKSPIKNIKIQCRPTHIETGDPYSKYWIQTWLEFKQELRVFKSGDISHNISVLENMFSNEEIYVGKIKQLPSNDDNNLYSNYIYDFIPVYMYNETVGGVTTTKINHNRVLLESFAWCTKDITFSNKIQNATQYFTAKTYPTTNIRTYTMKESLNTEYKLELVYDKLIVNGGKLGTTYFPMTDEQFQTFIGNSETTELILSNNTHEIIINESLSKGDTILSTNYPHIYPTEDEYQKYTGYYDTCLQYLIDMSYVKAGTHRELEKYLFQIQTLKELVKSLDRSAKNVIMIQKYIIEIANMILDTNIAWTREEDYGEDTDILSNGSVLYHNNLTMTIYDNQCKFQYVGSSEIMNSMRWLTLFERFNTGFDIFDGVYKYSVTRDKFYKTLIGNFESLSKYLGDISKYINRVLSSNAMCNFVLHRNPCTSKIWRGIDEELILQMEEIISYDPSSGIQLKPYNIMQPAGTGHILSSGHIGIRLNFTQLDYPYKLYYGIDTREYEGVTFDDCNPYFRIMIYDGMCQSVDSISPGRNLYNLSSLLQNESSSSYGLEFLPIYINDMQPPIDAQSEIIYNVIYFTDNIIDVKDYR